MKICVTDAKYVKYDKNIDLVQEHLIQCQPFVAKYLEKLHPSQLPEWILLNVGSAPAEANSGQDDILPPTNGGKRLDTDGLAISFADIKGAADRLKGIATRTPIMTSKTLDKLVGGEIFLKCENFQRMGAFKFRGAYNRLAQLTASERHGGVVAYSSGNHAQGVALAAQILG